MPCTTPVCTHRVLIQMPAASVVPVIGSTFLEGESGEGGRSSRRKLRRRKSRLLPRCRASAGAEDFSVVDICATASFFHSRLPPSLGRHAAPDSGRRKQRCPPRSATLTQESVGKEMCSASDQNLRIRLTEMIILNSTYLINFVLNCHHSCSLWD